MEWKERENPVIKIYTSFLQISFSSVSTIINEFQEKLENFYEVLKNLLKWKWNLIYNNNYLFF